MKRLIRLAFSLVFFLFGLSHLPAAPILVSLSSPDDLSNLTVGQTVTINVNVSNFAADDMVNLLSADVLVPASSFGVPTLPVPGAAVPDAGGSLLVVIPGPHVASVTYDDLIVPSSPMTADGVFFSFMMEVTGIGSGQIQFDPNAPPQIIGTNNMGDLDVEVGDPLNFNVNSGPETVIPEPSSVLAWFVVGSALGLVCWQRRRRGEL